MKYAVINTKTDEVENVIKTEEKTDFDPGEGKRLKPTDGASVSRGDRYEDGEFVRVKTDPEPRPEPVDRSKISEQSYQAFKEAHKNGDTERKIAVLWEILTGEEPPE